MARNTRLADQSRFRKTILSLLQDADGWVLLDSIKPEGIPYPRMLILRMIRGGMIESRVIQSGVSDDSLYVRIKPKGREALATERFTYKSSKFQVLLQKSTRDGARELAKEIRQNGIDGLLRVILARKNAFIRWYRNVNAEELGDDDK